MDRFIQTALSSIAGALLGFAFFAGGASAAPDQNAVPSEQRIRALIEQLGDKDYAVRQYAQEQLARMGFDAYEALGAAQSHEDPEIANRARYLLRKIRSQWATQQDPPDVQQLLQGYDLQDARERLRRIQLLGQQPGAAGIPALCRLVKFEKSPALSSAAGLEILNCEPADKAAQERLVRSLRENLLGSRRPAARWLLAYLKFREDPAGGLAEWARQIESELASLQRSGDSSSPSVVAALLYQLAQAYARQGNSELAEKAAQRALTLSPGNSPEHLESHLKIAWTLRRRGLFKWAEAEFRRVAGAGMPTATVIASNALAEMFHDQGNHQAAAETLRTAVEAFDQKRIRQEELAGRRRHEMVARMHYFSACQAKEQGDKAAQLKHLEEALRADPAEVDSVIAYYQFPDAAPEHRKKAEKLVDKAAALAREQIADEPDDPNSYNQFAWLIGNTKGNLDEALKYSKLSLELSPNNSAYLDTLAHVHFARGELEEAVQCQAKAVELEPHSGLIVKELQTFRAALEAKKNHGKQ